MPPGRKKCSVNELRLRVRLAEILEKEIGRKRGAISEAARKTGIKKQSLSLYMQGRATPTSETLRILCSILPSKQIDIEGIVISAAHFAERDLRFTTAQEQLSLSLTDAILSIPENHLKVEVVGRRPKSIDLKVSIDFDSSPKAPHNAGNELLAAAS